MKSLFVLLVFSCITSFSFSQDFAQYKDVEFKTGADAKTYDTVAHAAANYILSTPVDENSNRLNAESILIKWMTASSDYSFGLDASVAKLGKKNQFIIMVYMAALAKDAFENPDIAKDTKAANISALHTIAVYAADEKNHVDLDKDLKKLIEADKNNKLSDFH